jgi:hypothetical protein
VNCLDCAKLGEERPAVGVCSHCGAGVCIDHLDEAPHVLHVILPINRPLAIDPPARHILCSTCAPAILAQAVKPHEHEP